MHPTKFKLEKYKVIREWPLNKQGGQDFFEKNFPAQGEVKKKNWSQSRYKELVQKTGPNPAIKKKSGSIVWKSQL